MVGKENAGNHYLNAAVKSESVEAMIENFLEKKGSMYPIETPKIDETAPPKGSALFYLGRHNPDAKERRIEELRVEKDVIGHLD